MRMLDDEDVARLLTPQRAVGAAREALVAYAEGRLVAPPRLRAPVGEELELVLTAGGLIDGPSGFRVYRAGRPAGDQLVAVWDHRGRLSGLVGGDELGVRRTGALGAAVTAELARADARRVGIVGSGAQAWSQLWATTAVRDLDEVVVFSRDPERRAAFASRVEVELGIAARAAETSETAVRDADIVILATRSTTPVIEASAVADGTHVVTVGPKTRGASETPPALAERAGLLTSDSPDQATAYPDPFFTDRRLVSAGEVIVGRVPGRGSEQEVTLHCSVGLAGSEVLVAQGLLAIEEPAEGG